MNDGQISVQRMKVRSTQESNILGDGGQSHVLVGVKGRLSLI